MLCAQRSRKRTIILSFELRRRSLSNVKIMFFFTISLVEHSSRRSVRSTKKMQSRVNFPDFSLTCSYIAKVTPLNHAVVVYALLCLLSNLYVYFVILEFTFHVKHCESNTKIVTIIPVRIKKRKEKKKVISIVSHSKFHSETIHVRFSSKIACCIICKATAVFLSKTNIFLINHQENAPKTLFIPNNNLNFAV